MPIRRQHRYFYPIDWPQLSAMIRFRRAGGAVRAADVPTVSASTILATDVGGMRAVGSWRDGQGRFICLADRSDDVLGRVRTTQVVLAHSSPRSRHGQQRGRTSLPSASAVTCCTTGPSTASTLATLFRRKAMGDLFQGPYPAHEVRWCSLDRTECHAPTPCKLGLNGLLVVSRIGCLNL